MTFSIWADIADAVADGSSIDKHEIATAVAKAVPNRHLRSALLELLPDAVLTMQRSVRQTVSGTVQRDAATSGYTARFRDMSLKDFVVHVPRGGTEHEAMRLGSCTVDDLVALVASYERRASEQLATAARYRRVANVVAPDGTVDDVSDDVLLNVWSHP